MGLIDIQAGEVTRIADSGSGRKYEVTVETGRVLFDKNPQRIRQDGRKRVTGDRGKVTLSPGETLYAYSADGATVYATPDNFIFDIFDSADSLKNRAYAEGYESIEVDAFDRTGIASGGNPTYEGYTNTSDKTRYVYSAAIELLTQENPDHIAYRVTIEDGDSNQLWRQGNLASSFDPDLPGIPIPNGGKVVYRVTNNSASSIDIQHQTVTGN